MIAFYSLKVKKPQKSIEYMANVHGIEQKTLDNVIINTHFCLS